MNRACIQLHNRLWKIDMLGRVEANSMAFVMSLARTKRVKYIGQDGSEVFQEDNRWHFLSAENLASQVIS